MKLITNVPGLEDKLQDFVVVQHKESEQRIMTDLPSLVLYRDRTIIDRITRALLRHLRTNLTEQSFDIRRDLNTYARLPHHIVEDIRYKHVFIPTTRNPYAIDYVGTRMKQADSMIEKLSGYFKRDGTLLTKNHTVNSQDAFGIKIIAQKNLQSLLSKISACKHIEIDSIEDYYQTPKFHSHVLENPTPSMEPAYRAIHLNATWHDAEHGALDGIAFELQLMDPLQQRYNAWEHRHHYTRLRLQRSHHQSLAKEYRIIVVEGNQHIWNASNEPSVVKIVKSKNIRHINGGKVIEVAPHPYAGAYVHINSRNYV